MRSRLEIIEDTGASGPELITLEAVKLELEIDDTESDDLINARITRFSNMIAEQCNRVFALSFARETFTFDVCECSRLPLTLTIYPVEEIDSVTVDGNEVTDYEFDAETGLLSRSQGGVWSGVVVVTYSGGYHLPSLGPATLADAVIEAIRDRMATSGTSNAVAAGIQMISSGEDTVRYFQGSATAGLPSQVIEMIKSFKRPGMA